MPARANTLPHDSETLRWESPQAYIGARIDDPGNAQAISVLQDGVCMLKTTAVGETRTLAIPNYVGQRLALFLANEDDAGDTCIVTASQAINAAGNTIMTFAEERDYIELIGVVVGAGDPAAEPLRWQVATNQNVALS